jgi:hypothetical protein
MSGSIEEWAETPPALAGILIAAPSLPSAADGPFSGEAHLTWAYAGTSATLDGSAVGNNPKNGVSERSEGGHQLSVSGLGACGRCSTTVASPVFPSTPLAASPAAIDAGQATTLDWTTPDGSFLAALIDRGLGERGASGSTSASPMATTTFRRLALTGQGGALAEKTVWVGGTPPPGDEIFADGFDSGGFGAWDGVVP